VLLATPPELLGLTSGDIEQMSRAPGAYALIEDGLRRAVGGLLRWRF
jgi:hypothetical protein